MPLVLVIVPLLLHYVVRSISCIIRMFLSALAWICALISVALVWHTRTSTATKSSTKRASKKTLVLDLDETLVHSRIHEPEHYNYAISLSFDDTPFTFYVSERPHVHQFIKEVSQLYDVVIFTASMQEYADPVINQLDPHRQYFTRRLYRESCTFHEDHFLKDLHSLGFDMSHTLIVDNSPISYALNRENALPIDSYTGLETRDEALIALLPVLRALVPVNDVRAVLGLQQMRL